MADQITTNPNAARDWNGDIVPAARMFTYLTGTTTPVVVFQDVAGTIPHPSPILADGNGIFPQVFYTGVIKIVVTDPDGEVLPGYPLDPAPRTSVGTSGASTISFLPTEDIPETNVQAALESVSRRAGGSNRNLIINGSGRINQRGYVSGTATSGANQFTLDRWFVVVSGQNLTFTGNASGRVMTAPAGGVGQVIEGANILGGSHVLNWDGTATAEVNGTARAKGESFTLPANTNVKVVFKAGTFERVQLERGSIVTPFEFRNVAQELALCQRYAAPAQSYGFGYAAASGNQRAGVCYYTTEMRANPTVSAIAGSGVNASGQTPELITTRSFGFFTNVLAAGAYSIDVSWFLDAELTA